MVIPSICPNCTAPIKNNICPSCGWNPAAPSLGKSEAELAKEQHRRELRETLGLPAEDTEAAAAVPVASADPNAAAPGPVIVPQPPMNRGW
jgi:hypothetical protein